VKKTSACQPTAKKAVKKKLWNFKGKKGKVSAKIIKRPLGLKSQPEEVAQPPKSQLKIKRDSYGGAGNTKGKATVK